MRKKLNGFNPELPGGGFALPCVPGDDSRQQSVHRLMPNRDVVPLTPAGKATHEHSPSANAFPTQITGKGQKMKSREEPGWDQRRGCSTGRGSAKCWEPAELKTTSKTSTRSGGRTKTKQTQKVTCGEALGSVLPKIVPSCPAVDPWIPVPAGRRSQRRFSPSHPAKAAL